MKLDEIKEIARQHNLKIGKANKTELVRAIQQAEGNQPCFNNNSVTLCGQHDCIWRAVCS